MPVGMAASSPHIVHHIVYLEFHVIIEAKLDQKLIISLKTQKEKEKKSQAARRLLI